VGSEQPFIQRDMRALVQRPHCGCEGLLTWAALVEASACAVALEFGSFIDGAAMGAYRTIWPTELFEMSAGGIFVGENLIGKVASHGQSLFPAKNYNLSVGTSSA